MSHELNHFFVQISTPFGFFSQSLAKLQVDCIRRMCQQALDLCPSEKIPSPLYPFVRDLTTRQPSLVSSSLAKILKEYCKQWSSLIYLENVFEGRNFPSVMKASRRKLIDALYYFERISQEIITTDQYFDLSRYLEIGGSPGVLARHPPQLNPATVGDRRLRQVNWLKKGLRPFGAEQVIEGLARQAQAYFLEPRYIPQYDLSSESGYTYWSCWEIAIRAWATKEELTVDVYHRMYCTFIALCDLALFTPIGPLYGRLRRTEDHFETLNPADRLLAGIGASFELGFIENITTQLQAYQTAVCKILGWRTPDDFLRVGASLSPKIEFWRAHRDACELRLSQSAAFLVVNDAELLVQDYITKHWPLTYSPNIDTTLVRPGHSAIQSIVDFFLPEWGTAIMLSGIPKYRALLPTNFPYAEYFANVQDESQFLEIFRRDNLWLHESRFRKYRG